VVCYVLRVLLALFRWFFGASHFKANREGHPHLLLDKPTPSGLFPAAPLGGA